MKGEMIKHISFISFEDIIYKYSFQILFYRMMRFSGQGCDYLASFYYTVDSRYLEIEGTLKNTSRYPYFHISDL